MLKKINEKKAYLLIEITNSDTKSKENILIEVKTALDKVDYKIKGPFKIQKDENENEQNAKSILIATGCDDKGWLKKQEKCDQFFTDVCLNNEFDIKLNNRVIRMNGKKSSLDVNYSFRIGHRHGSGALFLFWQSLEILS